MPEQTNIIKAEKEQLDSLVNNLLGLPRKEEAAEPKAAEKPKPDHHREAEDPLQNFLKSV